MGQASGMSVSTDYKEQNHELIIHINGRFDFRALHDFRDSYEKNNQQVDKYTIDLENSDYLDSSALGMLLTLRDYAGGDDAKIQIVNTPADIKRILYITKLDSLFTIE